MRARRKTLSAAEIRRRLLSRALVRSLEQDAAKKKPATPRRVKGRLPKESSEDEILWNRVL